MIDSLKIGYRRYRVVPWDEGDAAENGRLGEISHRSGEIRVADSRPIETQAETIVHEVLHALMHDSGADWTNDDEENIVRWLTPRLTAFLADNPDQVREILDMLTDAG